jgi:hypothetical protein
MNPLRPRRCSSSSLFLRVLFTMLPAVAAGELKPTVAWQVTEQGTMVADIVAIENGCVALCTTQKPDSTYSSRLIWLDETGRVFRSCSLGYGQARAISDTRDSGFVLVGHDEHNEAEITVMDSVGRVLWRKTYHYGFSSDLADVIPLTDGGFLAVGDTISAKPLRVGAVAIRTDEQGDVRWANVFKDEGDTHFTRAVPTQDGGFLLIGTAKSRGPTKQDILVVKIDGNGRELSRHYYGTEWFDWAADIQTLGDGTAVLVGTDDPLPDRKYETLLMRLDSNGDTLWYGRHSLPGETGLHATALAVSSDDGLVCAGYLVSQKEPSRMFAMGFDLSGNRQWLLDSIEPWTNGFCIARSPRGEYFVGGTRRIEKDWRALVVKINVTKP